MNRQCRKECNVASNNCASQYHCENGKSLSFLHEDGDDDNHDDTVLDMPPIYSPLVAEKKFMLLSFMPRNAAMPSLSQLEAWHDSTSDNKIHEGFESTFVGNIEYFE